MNNYSCESGPKVVKCFQGMHIPLQKPSVTKHAANSNSADRRTKKDKMHREHRVYLISILTGNASRTLVLCR